MTLQNSPPSEDELITELHRLTDMFYRPPTASEVQAKGAHSIADYQAQFGTFDEAIEKAGVRVAHQQAIPTEDLLNELHRLADKLGETPSSPQMDRHGKYSVQCYQDRFEKWNTALERAGLQLNQQWHIFTDELLDALRRVAHKFSRAPTTTENDKYGAYSSTTYRDRFGTWKQANNAAGIPYGNQFPETKFEAPPEQCRLCDEAKQGSLLFHQWQYGLDVAGCYLCEDCHSAIHTGARPDKDTKWILSAIENLGQQHRKYHKRCDVTTITNRYNIPSELVVKYVFQTH